MSKRHTITRLLLAAIAAVASALVVTSCAIQLRGDADSALSPSSLTQLRAPVAAELERCRAVTSEQVANIQECRRVWVENRRRFLGQSKAAGAPSVDAQPSTAPSSSAQPKDPGRLLLHSSPSATAQSE